MAFYNKIHCKYTGIKGFVHAYEDGLKYRMLTEKAKYKAKVLVFWEKHGLVATMDAFPVSRPTLFLWKKKLRDNQGKLLSLNDKKRIPKTTRKREWPFEVRQKIKQIRRDPLHPNLGPEKIYPLLLKFCNEQNLKCPKPKTIARVIADDPEKMRIFPQKISHFGKIKKANRQKVLRKPKGIKPEYPGHLIALDTIEKFINGTRRYVITFEDIYTRFSFAWATSSHVSKAAEEFFELCSKVFPYSFNFLYVLTDNGSEFKKYFSEKLCELHLTHFHTYPKTPKMNAHVERFNKTIQDDWIDWHLSEPIEPDVFNRNLMDYLIFYNTERVHYAFQNKLSPIQFMIQWQNEQLLTYQTAPHTIKLPYESKIGWHYTSTCQIK
ncbi:MAG: integrase core domain-containing protein [Patescibacteria group bacterium]